MKIAVAKTGYVGLSFATLLSQNYEKTVKCYDSGLHDVKDKVHTRDLFRRD